VLESRELRDSLQLQKLLRYLIEQRIEADPPEGPRGVKSEHPEIVVEVEGMGNRVVRAVYATHRYLKVPLPLRFR